MNKIYEMLVKQLNEKDLVNKNGEIDINKLNSKTVDKKDNETSEVNNETSYYDLNPNFFAQVNPAYGMVRKDSVFKMVSEFQKRNKDLLLFKSKEECFNPFCAVNREELITYLASSDDKAKKDLYDIIDNVYLAREESEMDGHDYLDYLSTRFTKIESGEVEYKEK